MVLNVEYIYYVYVSINICESTGMDTYAISQNGLLISSSDFITDFYTTDGRFHRAIELIYTSFFAAKQRDKTRRHVVT